jgi:environmental stress-induced protein Ves
MTGGRFRTIACADVAPVPWRNGGGHTRTLITVPDRRGDAHPMEGADDWRLRLSVADVDRDGPFSAYPGVARWFAVLSGAGVELAFAGRRRPCTADEPPLAFDGAAAPGCRLIDGATRDLNLMWRGAGGDPRAAPAILESALDGVAWRTEWPWRAVYVDGAVAELHAGDGTPQRLAPGTLALDLPPGPLCLRTIGAGDDAATPPLRAFWIGADLR